MKVSLIVTVYNCEQYLGRCFESLETQTYGNLEIIVVNDGSIDLSAKLCDEYEQKNINVKVIHKINEGTVSARRAGIKAATGEVVCFVDGDDWIDKEFCSKLVQPFMENENVEVVSSGLRYEYILNAEKNYVLFDGAEPGFYGKSNIENYLLPNLIYDLKRDKSAITTSVCCKMIKRNIALDAMADMDDKLTFGEDGAYVLSILARVTGVYVMKEAFYHYEQHQGSQNYKFAMLSYEQLKKLQKCMYAIATKANIIQLMKTQIDYYIKSYLNYIQKSVFEIDEDGRIYLFPEDLIELGSRIVIHGAGKVGQQYIKYIKKTEKYSLIGWTDKNRIQGFIASDIPCSISEITKLEYDYIILASNEDYILEQMKKDICNYNIPQSKILIKKPVSYRL